MEYIQLELVTLFVVLFPLQLHNAQVLFYVETAGDVYSALSSS